MSELINLALAVGLGLLVGLQRQSATDEIAGIRTFPIIALAGALCGLLARGEASGVSDLWLVAAGLMAVVALLVTANLQKARMGEPEPGMTTEAAAIAIFLVGAALSFGHRTEALLATGMVTVLLQWKVRLHGLVDRIRPGELRSIAQLVLLALVILPLMPNQTFGRYDVLNPFQIWSMVVLIVGLSLAAYLAARVFGTSKGALLAGLLGGLISSTATTLSLAQRSREDRRPGSNRVAAVVILIASAVVFPRVLIEIQVVHPPFLKAAAPPLLIVMAAMIALVSWSYFRSRAEMVELDQPEPPSNLREAIVFGALYAAILFGVAFAKERLGDSGLYAVAFLSGLTDMDAITLSTAQLVKAGRIDDTEGWRLILLGGVANLVFKAGAVAVVGSPGLRRAAGAMFAGSLVVGVLVWWLGPSLGFG